MARYFKLDEANDILREAQPVLAQLRADRNRVAAIQATLQRERESNGSVEHAEAMGQQENQLVDIVRRMQEAVAQIDAWGITLRDISTGLIDFPALANGRPIWLCWRLGEGDIEWWHETNVGFDGRQPLAELT
ncbi:MAG TPA: DUF2203 domain-containing protein [Candidatus Limnocylindrales bacterium]|nr:DUF2203 domain-containing protein [Candidatus Limnocylindrales bacterium]